MPADPQRARELFLHAVGHVPPDEWGRYVAEACGGDAELERQVSHWLQVHRDAGSFLEPPAVGPGLTIDQPARERPGTVLGAYKLLQELGEGGMGTVFMAEQTDPVRRTVALKIIKPGMDSRHVLARFEAERQALAMMDHPNIAKVLDAGQSPPVATGGLSRPYFVMELVKGIPITRYCDEHRLTPKQRLELFLPVCQAIQHAHQKGIIHRDLKPSNVLVAEYDDKPMSKVIDFGIAKAAGPKLTDRTLFTEFGQVVGTLEYMSPEQAKLNALDIDTRSDIYALGVLLYELLTGTTPFEAKRFHQAAFDEMLRIIREEEPQKPSTRLSESKDALPSISAQRQTEPAKLPRLVRGDLDWIVMKCLEKDRNRRYETANGLAIDLERYLADEPVSAGPPGAGYRLRKFVRRNRGPVLAAGFVFLALLGGVVATSWGLFRAEQARQGEEKQRLAAEAAADRATKDQERAELAFAKAKQAVERYLDAVTDDPDLKHKHDLHSLRKKLLEAAAPFYQWFTDQKPGDAALEDLRGRAYQRLAAVRLELGDNGAALKDFESAQAIFGRLVSDSPSNRDYRQQLANCHNNIGMMLKDLGRARDAQQAHGRAMDIYAMLAADFPAVAQHRDDLAASHNNIGILLEELGQRSEAEQAYRRAVDILEKLVANFPAVPQYRYELSQGHNNLGIVLTNTGQPAAAEQALRRAVELDEKLAAEFPTVPSYRQDLARANMNLGFLLAGQGQGPAAEKAYRHAMSLYEKLSADFLTVPSYRQQLGGCLDNLGLLLFNLKQGPAAEEVFRRALTIHEKLVADFPAVPAYRMGLARTNSNLGNQLQKWRQWSAAELVQRRAVDILEKLVADFPAFPDYKRDLGACYVNLGNLLNGQGQAEPSLAWYAKAISVLEPLVRDDPRLTIERSYLCNAYAGRATTLDRLGRHAEAARDWDQALAFNDQPPYESDFRRRRAISLVHAGEHTRAVAEANALADMKDVTSEILYDLACVCAIASTKVKDENNPAVKAGQHAARAVELLRHAVAKGYKDIEHLKKDEDFTPLRGREDFQKLLAELEAQNKESDKKP